MAESDNRRRNTGPASLLRMEAVQSFVEDAFIQNNIPEKDIRMFLIACDEIFSNVCRYSKAKEVAVECSIKEDRAVLLFEDDGIEFNPLQSCHPEVKKPLEDRKAGGLGIYMVEKLMDEMNYERTDGKNRLIMTKQRMT
ncbi:MAG: ATP-binding protein [Lachnospiraceae bacterium]|nr:ATP-binding protein [Lachnospiraceae bacterium]